MRGPVATPGLFAALAFPLPLGERVDRAQRPKTGSHPLIRPSGTFSREGRRDERRAPGQMFHVNPSRLIPVPPLAKTRLPAHMRDKRPAKPALFVSFQR